MNPIARAAQKLAGVQPIDTANANPRLGYQAKPSEAAQSLPIDILAAQLKKSLARKALLGASSSLIPLPLIDLAVDAILLANMLNEVHEKMGLTPAQINGLDANKRQRTYAAIQFVGNRAIGTLVTRAVVTGLVKGIGLKLTAQQLTKAVPIAGQVASAALNFATLRHLVNTHIDDCVRVVKQASV